jgi:hypothetical protein
VQRFTQDAIAVEEHEFRVRRPGALTLKYRFKVGEEAFKAPMVCNATRALPCHAMPAGPLCFADD